MTGARISGSFDELAAMEAALARVAAIGARPEKLLRQVGVAMASSTRSRFNAGVDPTGAPWTPLLPDYAAIKRTGQILVESGMQGGLQGSIVSEVQGREAVWGSNKVYAAIHQFGGVIRPKNAKALVFRLAGGIVFAGKVTIPARPYLGLSLDDREEVQEIADGFLQRAMRS